MREQRVVVRRHNVGNPRPGQREALPKLDQRKSDTERRAHVLRRRAGSKYRMFYYYVITCIIAPREK